MKKKNDGICRVLSLIAIVAVGVHLAIGADVSQYAVLKGQLFNQNSTAAPTVASPSGFVFQATVNASATDSVLAASVAVPSTSNEVLAADGPDSFQFEQFLASLGTLNSTYATGTYTFAIETLNEGTNMPSLTIATNHYPNAPRLTNWAQAQMVDATSDFTLFWQSFSGGTSNDITQLIIQDSLSNEVFNSGGFGDIGTLSGTNGSVLIPAGTLETNQQYRAQLLFLRIAALDTNAIPGAIGLAGLFSATQFDINTDTNLSALNLITTVLSNAEITVPYSATLVITGGLAPYVASPEGGSLPNSLSGVNMDSSGIFSGTPTRLYNPSAKTANSKKASFKVVVTDQLGATVSRKFKLRVFEPVAIDTKKLPDGTLSNAYSAKLKASSGSQPYTWMLSNSLPAGLNFDITNAIVSGVPTTTGAVTNIVFKITDSLGGQTQQVFSLTIR